MTLGGAMIVNFITSDKLVFRAAPSPGLAGSGQPYHGSPIARVRNRCSDWAASSR